MSTITERFARHALDTEPEAISRAAVEATRTFLLDSLGVGVAGSAGPYVRDLIGLHAVPGAGESRVLGTSARLPAAGAAFCNAYQIHNSEFDCIHEAAVVHPMAVLLGATLAWLDRGRHRGDAPVGGAALIAALTLGVDVACHIGAAARAPMRFFRPATAGALGATAALGRLAGFDRETWIRAMGIVHAQLCGTMQAHREGSPLLAMQAGFNARNAVVAIDMAAAGIPAPTQPIEGEFGYLRLFEGEFDEAAVTATLGTVWRITEVAHKPFPSGRATHGIIDACLSLAREYGFEAADVERITARVPPLTHRLVGRPPGDVMEPNYARLCAPYAAARALLTGGLGIDDFRPDALADAATLGLAGRITVEVDGNPDPNALTPIAVNVTLSDGAVHERTLHLVYGNPAKPMTREAHLAKFRRNVAASLDPLAQDAATVTIETVDALEREPDVTRLLGPLTA